MLVGNPEILMFEKIKADGHRPLKARPFTIFPAFQSKAEVILFGESSPWQLRLVPVQFLVNSTTSSKASFFPNYPGFRKTVMSTEAATVPRPHPIINSEQVHCLLSR